MAPNYSAYPRSIFGRRCTQLRANRMKPVLLHFGVACRNHATKLDLLPLLAQLEKRVSPAESTVISLYLSHKTTQKFRDAMVDGFDISKRVQRGGSAPRLPIFDTETPVEEASVKEEKSEESKNLGPPQQECSVCMEDFAEDGFPAEKITNSCEHPATICRTCLSASINSQIPDVEWDQITCPECPEVPSFAVVREWASKAAFDQYDQKAFQSFTREMPNFTMCLGPNCGSGQDHERGNDEPIMTCTTCGFKTCFVHKMPWHTGQTCEEYDTERRERVEQEAASTRYFQSSDNGTRTCPNLGCGVRIQKNGGCDHMTCKVCRHQVCWICNVSYSAIRKEGNSAHLSTCTHYFPIDETMDSVED